ncbi:MAG TPA: Crp/Fnr family transcriptional regulator [Thioalkalivibrio sp.]|nr:Crp/Fnr family transcriptional regulator [Thioalkalivibrio sp.]
MSQTGPALPANRLLTALPHRDRQRFVSRCTPVNLEFSTILTEPGQPIDQVYFPMGSVVSLVAPIEGHDGLEVALVGDEGMTGTPIILGVSSSPLRAQVQGEGPALCMSSVRFKQELKHSPALQTLLKRYVQVMICQLAQSAGCARYHVLEARLARWLLMTQDRAHSNHFHLTQEFMAYMLGVRRVGVTTAASSLQARKLISYSRGEITIHDRDGLEAAACACYRADIRSYAHLIR